MSFQLNADDSTHTLEEVWPPLGLRIESPNLVLRHVRETDFPAYLAAASSGVKSTERSPFVSPWDENSPAALAGSSLPWLYSQRSRIGPDSWYLMLAVFTRDESGGEDQLIGMQDVYADSWPVLRTVTSGSWLRRDAQGQGHGTQMRAAMLMWAFDHFGAEYAESGAYDWNTRSLRVSRSLGYFQSGTRRVTDAHGTQPEWEHQLRLPKNDFIRPPWTATVTGSDRLRAFFQFAGHDDATA
ncbi:GNAT family N-acetyltransferase [Garicola koreensis]|uniref:GNAT family N-acetyltransferase n=1 Tax=Garicola koreensis TaxID=1262554 RepID=UPI0031F06743